MISDSRFWKKAKGSLTLETALVLPIFLSLAVSLISILEMMSLYAGVEFALHETAREIALMTYPVSFVKTIGEEFSKEDIEFELPDEDILNPVISETLVRGIFTEKFGVKKLNNSLIKNNSLGIMFLRSDIVNEKGDVDLIVTYRVEPFFNLFGVGEMTFSNRVKMHSWVGYIREKREEDGEYVYITENASVYHTHRSCTHLRLTISTVRVSEVGSLRNNDGKKYHFCQKCAKNGKDSNPEFVFITSFGESYHTSLSCSGLKRTVYKVRLSEVSGLRECERCAGYIQGEIKESEDEDESD